MQPSDSPPPSTESTAPVPASPWRTKGLVALIVVALGVAGAAYWKSRGSSGATAAATPAAAVAAQILEVRAAGIRLQEQLRTEPQSASVRLAYARHLLNLGDADTSLVELDKAGEAGASPADTAALRVEALVQLGRASEALALMDTVPAADRTRWRGRVLAADGQWKAALVALRAATQENPGDVPSRLGMAAAFGQTGDAAGEERMLREAAAAETASADVQLAWGMWLVRHGQFAAAREPLRLAADLAGRQGKLLQATGAWTVLADADFAAGDFVAAADSAAALARLMPGSSTAEVRLAKLDLAQNRAAQAEERLRAVLQRTPDSAEAKLYLGVASAALGKMEAARMYFGAASAAPTTGRPARRMLGSLLLERGQAEEVVNLVGKPAAQDDDELLALGGRASLLTGDLDAALAYFRRGVAAAPKDVQRRFDLARALLGAGRPDEALGVLQGIEVPEAQSAEAALLRMTALTQAGRRVDARRELQRVATDNPSSAKKQWLVARGLIVVGDLPGAREALGRVAKLEPTSAEPQVALGMVALAAGDLPGANTALDAALAIEPTDGAALLAKAHVASVQGRMDEVRTWLQKASNAGPKAVAPRLALARLALLQRDPKAAAAMIDEVRALAPGLDDLEVLEAALLEVRGDRRAAVAAWERLAAAHPRSAEHQSRYARGLAADRRPGDAAIVVGRALALDPGDTLALSLSGDLAMLAKKPAVAVDTYGKAARAQPTRELAIKQSAALRAAKSADPGAPLRRWLQLRPDDVPVRLALSSSLMEAGRAQEAMAELDLVLKQDPTHAGAANNLAWLKAEAGDVKGALPLAQAAHTAEPRNPQYADTYAYVLAKSGQREEAARVLRAAQAAAPNDPTLAARLKEVTAAR